MAKTQNVLRTLGRELIDLSYKDLTFEDYELLVRSLRESASLLENSLKKI